MVFTIGYRCVTNHWLKYIYILGIKGQNIFFILFYMVFVVFVLECVLFFFYIFSERKKSRFRVSKLFFVGKLLENNLLFLLLRVEVYAERESVCEFFCHFFEWNLNYKHFKIGNNKYEFDLKLNLTDRELKCQKYIYFDVHSAYIILDSATERLSVLFLYGLSLETFNITSQFFCWCVFPYFSPIFGERNSVSNWYFVLIEKYTWF